MPALPVTRSSFATWDRISVAGLLSAIAVLWLAARAFFLMPSTGITTELGRVSVVPVVIGVLAYSYTYPVASIPELVLVTVWGIFAQRIANYGWYLTFETMGTVSISASLLSGTAQARLMVLLRFLGLAIVFAGFYAAAGSRRDRSVISALIMLAVPAVLLAIQVIV
ncbi:hypothetical protein [Halovivax cerinus]|uniref:Uncharacterized protein n=1 Tax=Halovivax cerinus TaxID=1487865 RepID=A0ABD5NRS8_9EURY|nr:hypothetical protein [Halovivax cerinus]